MTHTPGPWFSQYDDNGFYEIGSETISIRLAFTYGEGDADEANARLIAQAPTLLAELKNARAFIQEHHDSFVETATDLRTGLIKDPEDILIAEANQELLDGIDDAIAKATGAQS